MPLRVLQREKRSHGEGPISAKMSALVQWSKKPDGSSRAITYTVGLVLTAVVE
jgi:hypothetical protein